MIDIEWIFFDCMETLVDVVDYPDISMYAWWAYNGCGYERLWKGQKDFAADYRRAKEHLSSSYHEYEEYDIVKRFDYIAGNCLSDLEPEEKDKVVSALHTSYWCNYKSNCIVYPVVEATLEHLSRHFKLGVVSNFMKTDGIEELLYIHGIDSYFNFVVTSVKTGWKKPHERIFEEAVKKAGVSCERILFIGDDYNCDYLGPRELGINTLLLDKKDSYTDIRERITNINQIPDYINKYCNTFSG